MAHMHDRLYKAIHVGSHWKKTGQNTQHKTHSKTKLPQFSHLLWHLARKRGGLILQCHL